VRPDAGVGVVGGLSGLRAYGRQAARGARQAVRRTARALAGCWPTAEALVATAAEPDGERLSDAGDWVAVGADP
jgi:hypothetical protein